MLRITRYKMYWKYNWWLQRNFLNKNKYVNVFIMYFFFPFFVIHVCMNICMNVNMYVCTVIHPWKFDQGDNEGE